MKMFEQLCPMKMDYCIYFPSAANDIHKYEHPPKETTQNRMIITKRPKYVDFKNTFQCIGQLSYYKNLPCLYI